MDNERVLDLLENIRSEIAKMAIALERHTLQLEMNSKETKDAKVLAEKALDCHTNCIARKKHDSNSMFIKDFMLYLTLGATIYSLYKSFSGK